MINEAKNLIDNAEKDLGMLSEGQKIDLIMDNILQLRSTTEAKALLTKITNTKGGKKQ